MLALTARAGVEAMQIPLTQGLYALVSPEDYDRVAAYRWHAKPAASRMGKFYARRLHKIGRCPTTGKLLYKGLYLHRLIMDVPPGSFVDHVNGDPLDNRRENLRLASLQLNAVNRRYDNTKSGFRGVSRQRGVWRAEITIVRKRKHLGCFPSKEEAARAYDAAAITYFGDFAHLNFPDEAAAARNSGSEGGSAQPVTPDGCCASPGGAG